MKIAAIHLLNYLEYAQVRGISANEVQKLNKGLPPNLSDETAQISSEDFYRVLQFINGEIKDELWGIKAGSFLALKLLGLIYRISLHTTTIEEAFHYLNSYISSTLPLVKAQTMVTKNQAAITVSIENDKEVINRVILENTLTVIAKEIRLMSHDEVTIRLGTPHYNRSYPEGWRKDAAYTLSFKPGILKATLRQRNHLQLDVLIPKYVKLIEELSPDKSFSNKVKVTMLSMSDPQLPDIQTISHALYLTPRTLQRRLGEENITFRKLLEDLKKEISLYMLKHNFYSVSAIAHVLGYAEAAAFNHAFKKWFGYSPDRSPARLKNTN